MGSSLCKRRESADWVAALLIRVDGVFTGTWKLISRLSDWPYDIEGSKLGAVGCKRVQVEAEFDVTGTSASWRLAW